MKKIKLTQNKYAIIDDSDYIAVSKYKWHYMTIGYAARDIHISYINGKQTKKKQTMHRFLLEMIDSKIGLDHINHNKLDNRRNNLRICSQGANIQNASLRKDNKTGYKGITILKNRAKKYWARISKDNKQKSIGCFYTIEEAANAYNDEAKKLYGKFAFTN